MTIKRAAKQYISILKINMLEEASLEFRLRKIDQTRNSLLDEIKHNDLMSGKYKKTCKYLNYVENMLILASAVTGCISVSTFVSLFYVLVGIASAIIVGITIYKSIIKKKEEKA